MTSKPWPKDYDPTAASSTGCGTVFFFGLILWVIFNDIAVGASRSETMGLNIGFWATLIIFGFIIRKVAVHRLKRKLLSAEEILSFDHRRPVFYLRSFNSDDDTRDSYNTAQTMGMVNPAGMAISALIEKPSYEQILGAYLNQVGPFIALSKPGGETVAGAARLAEAKDSEWKNVVETYLLKSQLVIMRAGETEGLLWEINKIFSDEMDDFIVIYMQFEGPQDKYIVEPKYRKFKAMFEGHTGRKLPDALGKNRYLHFDEQGNGLLEKSLNKVLLAKKLPVERNSWRAYLKGMFHGASNLFKAPYDFALSLPLAARWGLHFLVSCLCTLAFAYLMAKGAITENDSILPIFGPLLLFSFLGGRIIAKSSLLFAVPANFLHWLLAFLLSLAFLYCQQTLQFTLLGHGYLSIDEMANILKGVMSRREWGEYKTLMIVFSVVITLFLGFVTWVYGLSKTELAHMKEHQA